jgi:hypothetical protein
MLPSTGSKRNLGCWNDTRSEPGPAFFFRCRMHQTPRNLPRVRDVCEAHSSATVCLMPGLPRPTLLAGCG